MTEPLRAALAMAESKAYQAAADAPATLRAYFRGFRQPSTTGGGAGGRRLAADHLARGSNTALSSRFARLRVRPAHDDAKLNQPAAEEWLLIEWPEGASEPDHYWLSTLPSADGRSHQAELADRTRLSGLETGGRARPLRRPRLARVSPSRKPMHCGLRIPGLREGDGSPLRTCSRLARPTTCGSRRLPTQSSCRCACSVTCRTRSLRCASASHAALPARCPGVPAAATCASHHRGMMSDTVGLGHPGRDLMPLLPVTRDHKLVQMLRL
jgi:hypothetical protein